MIGINESDDLLVERDVGRRRLNDAGNKRAASRMPDSITWSGPYNLDATSLRCFFSLLGTSLRIRRHGHAYAYGRQTADLAGARFTASAARSIASVETTFCPSGVSRSRSQWHFQWSDGVNSCRAFSAAFCASIVKR
jgi:hypothetical protein